MKRFVLGLSILFWPLSLFLTNSFSDFLKFLAPSVILLVSLLFFRLKLDFHLYPLVILSFLEPKLALLPLFLGIGELWEKGLRRITLVFIVLSVCSFALNWNQFKEQTIFKFDYQAQQQILRNTYLYPSVFMARVFQNKARIYLDKANHNFFALVDPNNYFFGFHPRQIIGDNQNLKKFPFISLVFIFAGIYSLGSFPHKRWVISVVGASILSLSMLEVFDKTDFILWFPLSLLLVHGINFFNNKPVLQRLLFILFFVFTIPQVIRLFVEY